MESNIAELDGATLRWSPANHRAVYDCRLSLSERAKERYFRGAKGDTIYRRESYCGWLWFCERLAPEDIEDRAVVIGPQRNAWPVLIDELTTRLAAIRIRFW